MDLPRSQRKKGYHAWTPSPSLLHFQISYSMVNPFSLPLSSMEKLFYFLSKADLSTILLILLQNLTAGIISSFLFLGFFSFFSLSAFFFSLSAYKHTSLPLFSKTRRRLFPDLFLFSGYFSISHLPLTPKSWTELTPSVISLPHHLCFLVTRSLSRPPTSRFCSHCCGETACEEHINGFLTVKVNDIWPVFGSPFRVDR